jgi:hypothetical protein
MSNNKIHSVTFNERNGFWEWAQKESGVDYPQTFIRDICYKYMMDYELEKVKAKVSNNDPASPPKGKKKQWGSTFEASFDSACHRCGKRIKAGQTAFKCDGGNLHPECYDAWVEEQ